MSDFTLSILGCFIGALLGSVSVWIWFKFKIGGIDSLSRQIIQQAEQEVQQLKHRTELEFKEKELLFDKELDSLRIQSKEKLEKEESRLRAREDALESRMQLLEKKISQVDKKEAAIAIAKTKNDEVKKQLEHQSQQLMIEMEKLSGLSEREAKTLLQQQLIGEVKSETLKQANALIKEVEQNAQKEAARILSTAINRLSVNCASECTTTTVNLPSPEIKGRIIGREGRNIRLFEELTGVNLLIDDTPNAVVISCFDPLRLEIAKKALAQLVADGRIHPTSIEKSYESAKSNVGSMMIEYGEQAAMATGQFGLHPELIKYLGGLKFRRSYAQNVLDHSIEVSLLMGMMAAELQLDQQLAKRIGLLHDIGKAASHEFEGSHALVGQNLALKFGESIKVANGIGCHHFEIDPITVEGSLCNSADAISASRPGARIESVEQYIKRISKLETIALAFTGIEKAYAMQAGRELVIHVIPEKIDEHEVHHLAKEVTKKIESDVQFPGKIRVTIIREKRTTEYAQTSSSR